MIEWFADTAFWIAYLRADDDAHERAVELANGFRGHIVTSQWVLLEFADSMSQPNARQQAVALIEWMSTQARIEILPAEDMTFQKGIALFQDRPDKEWSLTDCISMRIMQERNMREALASDHHFQQAGFIALLKEGLS